MLQKINFINPSKKTPSISLVYSSATPLAKSSTQIKVCCPWHREHIRFVNAAQFNDFKNDILNGGFNCMHASCRARTFEYILCFLGCRPYKNDGGVV